MSPGLLPTLIRQLRRPADANPSADAELVRRYASLRDGEAFAELLRRHGPLVWGVCRRRLPNRADAEDAFQSTFLVLAKRAAAIRRPEALGCWLYGVAHRVAGRMRGRSSLPIPADVPSATAPVAETATVREFLTALDEELLRLPEKLRGPLVLCFLQERTQDEAAKQLGVSLSTLKRRLDAGRELLRVRLNGRGVELSAALAAMGLTVPSATADAAVRAAVAGVSAGAVSANVLTVTEGVVRAMTYTKFKAWAAGVLMAAASVGGTGYFATTGSGQTGSPDGGRPKGVDPAQPSDPTGAPGRDRRVEALRREVQAAEEAVRAQESFLTQLQKLPAISELEILQARVLRDRYRLYLETARKQLADFGAAKAAPAAPPELHKLRQEKLKLAREMLKLVTQRAQQGQNPFPDVYEWSKRVFELEQEVDPSPAARLLAAKEHYTRMRMLQDRVQTSDDPLDRGTVGIYRLEAETWAKEAEARRATRPSPADEGAAVPEEVERLRVELEKVKAEALRECQRAEQLADRLQKLMDELEKSRPEGVHPFQPWRENPSPTVPAGFKGTVQRIEGTAKDLANGREVWVEITPGADAGLKQGAILTVRRMAGASGKYLGTITLVRVNAKDAVGRFSPANPRGVEADDLPKPGDELAPRTSVR